MKISIAADHRGFKLKNYLIDFLQEKGHSIIDFGTYSPEPCDYPDVIVPACVAVKKRKAERGIVICHSGIGASIAANRLKGIRAALVHDIKTTVLSRRHNNSNVLVLSSGFITRDEARRMISRWLATEFDGGRHARRLKKIDTIEEK